MLCLHNDLYIYTGGYLFIPDAFLDGKASKDEKRCCGTAVSRWTLGCILENVRLLRYNLAH